MRLPGTYISPAETGLYYLQSRYYDPEIGRFINADKYISTGIGILGYNMFCYCNNNPVIHADYAGQEMDHVLNRDIGMGYGAVGLYLISLPTVYNMVDAGVKLAQDIGDAIAAERSEVYDYSRTMRQELADQKEKMPQVHHIVPVGDFSTRSPQIGGMVNEMHEILEKENINRYIDPMNLMLVSSKTHASLHTDAYIAHVYSYIKQTEGSAESIYAMLFLLRIEIAAMDGTAVGY